MRTRNSVQQERASILRYVRRSAGRLAVVDPLVLDIIAFIEKRKARANARRRRR